MTKQSNSTSSSLASLLPYSIKISVCLLLLPALSFAAKDEIPDLGGNWKFASCVNGEFNLSCMVLEENDSRLTERAIAYRDAIDEIAQPKYDCAPMPIPHMWTDPYSYQIKQLEDRVQIYYGKDDVVRTIWLDGHGHSKPAVNDFLYFGYSTGKYKNKVLEVVTSKFTFDPQGLNADFRIPSSTQKQITEHFSIDSQGNLVLEISTVDTFFLKEPWTFRVTSQPETTWDGSWQCDLEASRQILKLMPPMYPEDPVIQRVNY